MVGYYSEILKRKTVSDNVKKMILMERAGLKVSPNKKNEAERELDVTPLKVGAVRKTFGVAKDDEFENELEEIISELEAYVDEDDDAIEFLKQIDFDCRCK